MIRHSTSTRRPGQLTGPRSREVKMGVERDRGQNNDNTTFVNCYRNTPLLEIVDILQCGMAWVSITWLLVEDLGVQPAQ